MLHRSIYQHTKLACTRLIPHNNSARYVGVPVRHFSLNVNNPNTTKVGVTLPNKLTGYLNHNNTEVTVGLWKSIATKLGLKSSEPPHKSSTDEDEDIEGQEEGEFDINLGEEDALHEVEAEIKRTALFTSVSDLHSTVKLNQKLTFNPLANWNRDSLPSDLRYFIDSFDNLFSRRKYLSAISAAELFAKRQPQFKHYALQCRAMALLELAASNTEEPPAYSEYANLCSVKSEDLIHTAAKDMEAALEASSSGEIASQYFNLSTHVAFFDNYYSLLVAKEITSFLIAKTSKEMKDTHMRLANLNALYSTHLMYMYAIQSHHRFRHAHMDSLVRNVFLNVIHTLTLSLRDHSIVPPQQSQEGELLGMLDFRSKLWESLDEKERAISDVSLALECGPTNERLIRRANIHHKMKNYQLAIDDIVKVVSNAPFDFELSWLSTLYTLNNEADKAIVIWRFILANLPTISHTADSVMYSKISNFAIHSRMPTICLFASGEGIAIETARPEPSHSLIIELHASLASAHYSINETKNAISDIENGLNWYQKAVKEKKDTEVVRKAAAELYFLRGSVYIYQSKIKQAFKDYDEAVRLDPAMLQRVKEFQDNITVTKNRIFVYINQYQIISFVLICAGLYVGFAVLR